MTPGLVGESQNEVKPAAIDDFTEHSYCVNALPEGEFADQAVKRTFTAPIQSIRVTIVSGDADDIGYVGDLLVAPGKETVAVGQVEKPVDVTSQVTVDGCTASLLLRTKDKWKIYQGWGPGADAPTRLPARLHWEVTFGHAVKALDTPPKIPDSTPKIPESVPDHTSPDNNSPEPTMLVPVV